MQCSKLGGQCIYVHVAMTDDHVHRLSDIMSVGFSWLQLTMMVEKTKSSSYKPQYGLDDISPRTAAPTPITCMTVTVTRREPASTSRVQYAQSTCSTNTLYVNCGSAAIRSSHPLRRLFLGDEGTPPPWLSSPPPELPAPPLSIGPGGSPAAAEADG